MGYTFDYSKEAFKNLNSSAHVGESEFVVKPGSDITIQGIYSLDYYSSDQFVKNRFLNHYKKIKTKCEKYLAKIEAFDANQTPVEEIFKVDQQLRYTWKQLFYYTKSLNSSSSSADEELERVKAETTELEQKINPIRITMFQKIEKKETLLQETSARVTKETELREKARLERVKQEEQEQSRQNFLRLEGHKKIQNKLRPSKNPLRRMQSNIV